MAIIYALNDKLYVAHATIEELSSDDGFYYRCVAPDAHKPLSMGSPVMLMSGSAAVGLTGTEKRVRPAAATSAEAWPPSDSYYVRGGWNLSLIADAFLHDRQHAREECALH